MNLQNSDKSQKYAQALTLHFELRNIFIAGKATANIFNSNCKAISCTSVLPFAKFYKFFCFLGVLIFIILASFRLSAEVLKTKPAQRIIALSPHSVELLYAIGAGDRIVGTVEYADYPKEALKIKRIGSYTGIQIEQVLALKPDLIIAWKSGNKSADLAKLESLGFNVFYTHPKNISQINDDLKKLGEMTGLQNNAQKVINGLKVKYKKIKGQYSSKKKVNIFYQLWHDPLRSIGSNNWIESLITDCGGVNLFNDSKAPYPLVSLESVLVKNPEVIIIPHHSGSAGAKSEIWKNWPEITAVKEKRIFTLNGDLLHRFTPRALDGLKLLCEKIDEGRKTLEQAF